MHSPTRAPEPPETGRSGVLFFRLLLLCVVACAACEGGAGDRAVEVNGETVRLGVGTSLHEVRLQRSGAGAAIRPDTVRARPGDVVRFTAADDAGYALVFDADALSAASRRFLEETRQLRGPPLIQAGRRWIVKLDDAPPGSYPFVCLAHGARGVLIVAAD